MAQASITDALSAAEEEVRSVTSRSSTKTSDKTKSRASPKLNLKDMDRRMTVLETEMKANHSELLDALKSLHTPPAQHTGGTTHTSLRADARALGDNAPSGRRRPTISLNNGIDEDIMPEDSVSLHPRYAEVRDLYGVEDAWGIGSHSSVFTDVSGKDKFKLYTNPEAPIKLGSLFGHTAATQSQIFSDSGLVLDQVQTELLNKSWRAQAPDRLSAYKEEYRTCFPVHEDTASMLEVPSLDDMLEAMLSKRHGPKDFKPWLKKRELCTQPLKAIESLAYQGHLSARMNIIAMAYLQQGMGSLLNTLQEKDLNVDRAVQTVRDLYDMSNKALDQAGRAGAYHQMVRRKAAVADSGLSTLKDVHMKVLCLPLTGDGVFGHGLQDKLKARKEQKEQLNDLIPEFYQNRASKRKFPGNDDNQNRGTSRKQFRVEPHQNNRGRARFNTSTYPSYPRENFPKNRPSGAETGRPKDKEKAQPSFRFGGKQ